MKLVIEKNITVKVQTKYLGLTLVDGKKLHQHQYRISIRNNTNFAAQLISREWEIHDLITGRDLVQGPGVVGLQPTIEQHSEFMYQSFCNMNSSLGFMSGHYTFYREDIAEMFSVEIPKFKLIEPGLLN